MNTLNIFIASSCELSDDRIFIGDCIRRLNDEYEVQGLQIQLLCWEDYCPEYTGERKQTEYNRDLVLKSQMVIGLFVDSSKQIPNIKLPLGTRLI